MRKKIGSKSKRKEKKKKRVKIDELFLFVILNSFYLF